MTPTINADTKVGTLLDAHPELEAVLVRLSPEFRRLSNPILRRTVARVATVGQAARIAGLPVPEVVNALRRALGQQESCAGGEVTEVGPEPPWAAVAVPVARLDADEILARGGTPVGELTSRLQAAAPGDAVAITAPFYPAPLIDSLRGKGHEVHARKIGETGRFEVLVRRTL